MNNYLKHYNREQQMHYLELNAMIDFMFLQLSNSQSTELNNSSLDNLGSQLSLTPNKNYNL